ncbi:sigma-70 family RNA polymerase sigma factor [Streptomyces sp. NPDC088354]|uniref:sigma-70 family RNA polymerase sigma factor n=1 Tax=Streptomyces sp. NPDC088354 TaxID=3365856 RepID=UPI0037F678C9
MIAQASPPATRLDSDAERELVDRARGGDREAFGALYNEHRAMVLRFIYYRVNGNRALAEDIASETFVRALRNVSRFTWQGGGFGAWLITIARNLVMDHFKAMRTKREMPHGDDMWELDGTDVVDVVVTDCIGIAHRELLVRAALRYLNEYQRTCIYWRFFRDLTVAETAAAMGIKEGAVKTLQYRAIRCLTEHLSADDLAVTA